MLRVSNLPHPWRSDTLAACDACDIYKVLIIVNDEIIVWSKNMRKFFKENFFERKIAIKDCDVMWWEKCDENFSIEKSKNFNCYTA